MHIFPKNPRFFFSILPNKEPFKSLRFFIFVQIKNHPEQADGFSFISS